MPRFITATVTAVTSQRRGIQRVEVDGEPAYVLTDLIGPVTVGDQVIINTTAVDRNLGTGGWHVVHWNLSRQSWDTTGPGQVMKLRYTSLQTDTGTAEEIGPFYPATNLSATPVMVCDLHSQMACAALAFNHLRPNRRLVYVMTDSAALPMALSDTVADLCAAGVLAATVSCGQAFGGDHEAVNIHSALEVADAMAGADAVVAAPGPGVVGTGTEFGFSGMEVAVVADAAAALKGRPVVAVRYSDADPRPRHQGVSHHTRAVLDLVNHSVVVPVPRGTHCDLADVTEVDVPELDWGSLTSMGRGFGEDPGFFRYSAAAGVAAAEMLGGT